MDDRKPGPYPATGYADCLGVWKRRVEEDPIGTVADDTTDVYWIQCQKYFVDIRIPANRPSTMATKALSDMNKDELLWLSQQKGFAGESQFKHDSSQPRPAQDTITWNRTLDYQPPANPDVGLISFYDSTKNEMVEYGVIGDDYKEDWQRIEGGRPGDGCVVSFTLSAQYIDGELVKPPVRPNGYFVVFGEYFSYLVGRTGALPASAAGKNMKSLIENTEDVKLCQQYLDCEVSHGKMSFNADAGNAEGSTAVTYSISRSTIPAREGSTEDLFKWEGSALADGSRVGCKLLQHVYAGGKATGTVYEWVCEEFAE
eukprot:GFYU01005395.1.p1 GENE.GFYU01005395.1~~GFYU01005395.1.p1  ORF type:complete len:314 (+),score=49.95 GFYU01005395.1:63-1004(+)